MGFFHQNWHFFILIFMIVLMVVLWKISILKQSEKKVVEYHSPNILELDEEDTIVEYRPNIKAREEPGTSDSFRGNRYFSLEEEEELSTLEEIDLTPVLPECFYQHIKTMTSEEGVSRGEQITRKTLESIFGVQFINTRPKWLRNPETNRCLELDCYSEELKIAAEYNGIQDYVWPNWTGCSKDEFFQQLRRDRYKKIRCEEENVYLINIPYTVAHDLIPDFILTKLPESVVAKFRPKMDSLD